LPDEIKSSVVDFRVGPETLLGKALRRYWIPACLSSEVAEPDCDPIRLALLGERLVAFRDTGGTVGILDESCPHRKASLVYGRNEQGGLRCLWHQWKFAVDGTVLETPNTSDCTFKGRVRAKAYPVRESAGIVWAYLGPKELEPPFFDFAWSQAPVASRAFAAIDLDCNFVKALEGIVDSAHVSLLHLDSVDKSPVVQMVMSGDNLGAIDPAPEVEVEAADFGFYVATIRKPQDGTRQVNVVAYVAPFVCMVPPTGSAFICVPQDDTHCRLYNVKWLNALPFRGRMLQQWVDFLGLDAATLEATGMAPRQPGEGPLGRRNSFVQDRAAMASGASWSGFPGVNAEDGAMVCSIPGITDYEGEHLTPSDLGVVKLRQLLWKLARGELLKPSDPLSVVCASAAVPEGEDWRGFLRYGIESDAVRLGRVQVSKT
jgi:phthalate 4,5-dioxygenase oxygenase subunit